MCSKLTRGHHCPHEWAQELHLPKGFNWPSPILAVHIRTQSPSYLCMEHVGSIVLVFSYWANIYCLQILYWGRERQKISQTYNVLKACITHKVRFLHVPPCPGGSECNLRIQPRSAGITGGITSFKLYLTGLAGMEPCWEGLQTLAHLLHEDIVIADWIPQLCDESKPLQSFQRTSAQMSISGREENISSLMRGEETMTHSGDFVPSPLPPVCSSPLLLFSQGSSQILEPLLALVVYSASSFCSF